MKKLLFRIFYLLSAVFFFGVVINYIFPFKSLPLNQDYMAALIDKERRLDSIHSPRLILVGGSNLAFGIDSELMERELNIPVVNMGLHAGLGLNFMLNEVVGRIHKGDIVILSIEYYLGEGNYSLLDHTTKVYPPAKEYIEVDKWDKVKNEVDLIESDLLKDIGQIQNILVYWKNSEYKDKAVRDSFSYRRSVFSEFGDVVGHLDKPRPRNIMSAPVSYVNYDEFIRKINSFANQVKFAKASLYFVFPCYMKSSFDKNPDVIEAYTKKVTTELNVKVLGTPQDFCFPDNYFFDAPYHPNKQGRHIRTKKLIALIKESSR